MAVAAPIPESAPVTIAFVPRPLPVRNALRDVIEWAQHTKLPDGRRVMLCDLEGGYELVLPDGATDPDAIWQQTALTVDLGDRKQGEGVSYGRDGRSLYASSEKKNSPLYLITRE